MSDNSEARPTVALAVEKISSLSKVTEMGFEAVNARLDKLEGLPDRMTRVEERVIVLERDRESRRIHWPTLLLGLAGFAVAAAALVTNL